MGGLWSFLTHIACCCFMLAILHGSPSFFALAVKNSVHDGFSRHVDDSVVTPADFNQTYSGVINRDSSSVYYYNYTREANETDAIRVHVSSTSAMEKYPILVVIKQQKGVLSWQIPLYAERTYPFWSTSRTLCPTINYHNEDQNDTLALLDAGDVVYQDLYIDLSSSSPKKVDYTVRAYQVSNFFIETNVPMVFNVTPSEPQYVEYIMPEGVDRVLVQMKALEPEKFCSYFSIQPVHCPVADVESELRIEGTYQTVTSRGAMVITRAEFPKFYIVITVKAVDYYCEEIENIIGPKNASSYYLRVKTVELTVTESLSTKGYIIAISACVSFFAGFYVITSLLLASSIVKWKYICGKDTKEQVNSPDVDSSSKVLDVLERDVEGSRNPMPNPSRGYPAANGTGDSSITNSGSSSDSQQHGIDDRPSSPPTPQLRKRASDSSMEDEVDFVDDAEEDKNIVRTKQLLFVEDLTRKTPKRLAKKDRQYRWSMITICIFYGLPVAQLVITYQRVLRNTGNEDLCYYNFACANPLGIVSDFNHVISNVGYVMLGFLFILIVRRRQLQYIKAKKANPVLEGEVEKGIPPQFELFYAMGLALVMEGLMSASYHICPSYSNFQFDTSFMYLIAGLGMLKVYQARHPDIFPNAYISYAFFALIILIAVLGVVYVSIYVWIAFAVGLIFLTLVLSAQIYFMGRWKLNFGIFRRIYVQVRMDGVFSMPLYVDRFALLLVIIGVNWTLAIMGPLWQPLDFASYMLGCFVSNLVLYVIFYMIMKLRNGERISRLTILFVVFSTLTWGGSLYLFFRGPINWQLTPSRSREVNQSCMLLDFYDKHDLWHMMSACSMFFSFMIMLSLDDDLANTHRTEIPVF